MENISVYNVNDHQILAQRLGKGVTRILSEAIELRGSAYLVVSGGSTPKPLFRYLSEQQIDWGKVKVTLADERCVDPDSAASNAKLVKENLLIGRASAARFISLFEGGEPQIDDQVAAGLKLLGLPRYDMVILGMGADGHTASIFPQATNREIAQDCSNHRLALLTDPVTLGPLRITQSVRRLLHTRHLAVHFTGAKKAELLDRIIKAPDPATWPISSFISQTEVPLEIFSDAPGACRI